MPKIADVDYENIDNIRGYMGFSTGVEVQLLSDDLLTGFRRCCYILEQFPHINYLVIHMPFNMVNLCYIHSNRNAEDKFIELIVECVKYSLKTGVKIDILAHVAMRLYEFLGIHGIMFLNHLVKLVDGTNVGFLLENSIINLNMDDDEDDVLTGIFRMYNSDKVNFCLDLCHFQSSEFVMKKHFEINDILLKKLQNVHFSMTRDNEGYKNKEFTHGRVHTSLLACEQDLQYLKSKGIDLNSVNLVTEINELEYTSRPDMNKELEYLRTIKLR